MNLDLSPTRTAHTARTVRTPSDVAALGTLLGVWAYPDDEVYRSGALMPAAATAGQRVVVITAPAGRPARTTRRAGRRIVRRGCGPPSSPQASPSSTPVTAGSSTCHRDHRTVSTWTGEALRRSGLTRVRLLHATLTRDVVNGFAADLDALDGARDVPPVSSRSELVVDLGLSGQELDRKIAALRAQASQTRSLEEALGAALYRRFVAAEQFRAAPDGAGS